MPLGGVGEDEGEVALDGLVAGEVVGSDFLEGEVVEGGEVQLGEVDGLAEFAAVGLGLVQFAEVGYGGVVEEDCGRAAGLEPRGGFRGEGDGGGPPVGLKRERRDSMAPLSSKNGASLAVRGGVVAGSRSVRPRESDGVSWTSAM